MSPPWCKAVDIVPECKVPRESVGLLRAIPSDLVLQQAFLLPGPVALALVGTLVVQLLALGKADLQLGTPTLPVQIQGDERIAAPLGGTDEAIEFVTVQQQLAAAGGIRLHVGGGRR